MYINNYVVISFLIITIMNVINFGTQDTDCIPELFPYDFDIIFCNLKINKEGSSAVAKYVGGDTWALIGDLKA